MKKLTEKQQLAIAILHSSKYTSDLIEDVLNQELNITNTPVYMGVMGFMEAVNCLIEQGHV